MNHFNRMDDAGWSRGDPCQSCKLRRGFAWGAFDEIDAGFNSVHDTLHFVWLEAAPTSFVEGAICDECINRLVQEGHLEAYYSDQSGPLPNLSNSAAAAAYQLGAKHMLETLRLPVDALGEVSATTARPGGTPWDSPRRRAVPLGVLVARLARPAADDKNPHTSGALAALALSAIGTPSDSLDWAKKAKLWARERSERLEREQQEPALLELELPGD